VAKLRERISVSKRARQSLIYKDLIRKKLDDVEVKEKYQEEISNRVAALESLYGSLDINIAWKSIRKSVKTSAKDNLGYHRLKHNKPWFDDEYSKLIDQWKQAKLQCLQNPSQINRDNRKNLRHETSRTFRNKKTEYLKVKINELEINNKNKNIRNLYRGINEFKRGYQPRIIVIKYKYGNLQADPQCVQKHNSFNTNTPLSESYKNDFFNQVLYVHGVHNVTQKTEPLVPELTPVKVEIATGKLKSYESPGTYQNMVEMIKEEGETCSEVHKEELPPLWN
jgi:hypothetical protein